MSFKNHHSPFKILLILPVLIVAFVLMGIFLPSQQAKAQNSGGVAVDGNSEDSGANPTPKKCCDCFEFTAMITNGSDGGSGSKNEPYVFPRTSTGERTIDITITKTDNSDACKDAQASYVISDGNNNEEIKGEEGDSVDVSGLHGTITVKFYCGNKKPACKTVFFRAPQEAPQLLDGSIGQLSVSSSSATETDCDECEKLQFNWT